VGTTSISAAHSAGTSSLQAWSASKSATELHHGTRDFVAKAGSSLLMMMLMTNANVDVRFMMSGGVGGVMVVSSTTEETSGSGCSGCASHFDYFVCLKKFVCM
jgi:hypothetical protein